MMRTYLDKPCPIFAPATAPGEAALAVVRTTGPGSIERASSCFSRPEALEKASGHSLVFGRLVDPRNGENVDEVVLAVFRAPRSPTGEDQVEISCHGSRAVVRRLCSILEAAGFEPALPGEFTFRAFVNGKTDLVRAEALDELVRARSDGARAEALRRLEGGLSRRLAAARAELLDLLAEAEVRLDYAEEDGSPGELFPRARLGELRDFLASLAESYTLGKLYRDGVRLVLAGRTNAGKSSLFNLLLREERSIVSSEPGTTRDWIEAEIELAGFLIRIVDTAGLRDAPGNVEAEGVARARRIFEEADLVLYLVDGREGLVEEDEGPLRARPDGIRVWNKIDASRCLPLPLDWIGLSAKTGEGLSELLAVLKGRLAALADPSRRPSSSELPPSGVERIAAEGDLRIANERQKRLLERTVEALDETLETLEAAEGGKGSDWLDAATLELREAAAALGELTGEISGPEVVETIFSRFCLGK